MFIFLLLLLCSIFIYSMEKEILEGTLVVEHGFTDGWCNADLSQLDPNKLGSHKPIVSSIWFKFIPNKNTKPLFHFELSIEEANNLKENQEFMRVEESFEKIIILKTKISKNHVRKIQEQQR